MVGGDRNIERPEAGRSKNQCFQARFYFIEKEDQPMELPELAQLIGTLGFPIVACCVVFWYLQKESENHKQEMNSMRDAVNANTSVIAELKMIMQQLVDKIT